MTYSHAKAHGQRSVSSEDRVETNRRKDGETEATALPATLVRLVKIKNHGRKAPKSVSVQTYNR